MTDALQRAALQRALDLNCATDSQLRETEETTGVSWFCGRLDVCNWCGKTPTEKKMCSGCNVAMYCSRDCQKADWKTHKLACKDLTIVETRKVDVDGVTASMKQVRLPNGNIRTVVTQSATNVACQLAEAAEAGKAKKVAKLLLKDEDPNAAKAGMPALVLAALAGHQTVVSVLLDGGADIDIQSHMGCTALIGSVQNKRIDITKLLIDRRADVNLADSRNHTAFLTAARVRDLGVMRALVDAGCHIHGTAIVPRFTDDITPLTANALALWLIGVDSMTKEELSFFIKDLGFSGAQLDGNENTRPILRALGDQASVRMLLEHGADPNVTYLVDLNEGQMASRQTNMMRFGAGVHDLHQVAFGMLSSSGGEPIIASTTLIAALHHYGPSDKQPDRSAADAPALCMLLEHKADPNLINHVGVSPLVSALCLKDWKAFEMLLVHGANPDKLLPVASNVLHFEINDKASGTLNFTDELRALSIAGGGSSVREMAAIMRMHGATACILQHAAATNVPRTLSASMLIDALAARGIKSDDYSVDVLTQRLMHCPDVQFLNMPHLYLNFHLAARNPVVLDAFDRTFDALRAAAEQKLHPKDPGTYDHVSEIGLPFPWSFPPSGSLGRSLLLASTAHRESNEIGARAHRLTANRSSLVPVFGCRSGKIRALASMHPHVSRIIHTRADYDAAVAAGELIVDVKTDWPASWEVVQKQIEMNQEQIDNLPPKERKRLGVGGYQFSTRLVAMAFDHGTTH